MLSKRVRMLVVLLLVCGMSVLTGYGQGLTAVTGTVTDPSGAVIPGVTITVTNVATGTSREVLTNEQGEPLNRALLVKFLSSVRA